MFLYQHKTQKQEVKACIPVAAVRPTAAEKQYIFA